MGIFIKVEINQSKCVYNNRGKELIEVCPVKIFKLVNRKIIIDQENEDECTLCDLCLNIYPKGIIKIKRMYQK